MYSAVHGPIPGTSRSAARVGSGSAVRSSTIAPSATVRASRRSVRARARVSPITEIAFASGFASVRRFNAAYLAREADPAGQRELERADPELALHRPPEVAGGGAEGVRERVDGALNAVSYTHLTLPTKA